MRTVRRDPSGPRIPPWVVEDARSDVPSDRDPPPASRLVFVTQSTTHTGETAWTACPQCRAANPAAANVCTVCGTGLRSGARARQPWRTLPLRARLKIVAICGLVVGVVLGFVVVGGAGFERLGYSLLYGTMALRAALAGRSMIRTHTSMVGGIALFVLALLLALLSLATLASRCA